MRPAFVALLLPALTLTACQTSVSADAGSAAAGTSTTVAATTAPGAAPAAGTGAAGSGTTGSPTSGPRDAVASVSTETGASQPADSPEAASPAPAAATSSASRSATTPNAAAGTGPLLAVAGVVDGDTIKVWIGGTRTKIRLIGVDTPETVKPGFGVACYGKQASSKMQSLVQSKQVRLAADPTQADVDKYGRLLRYVFLADGTNVSQALIDGGFGREYTYAAPYKYRTDFLAAQANAQAHKLGLWGSCSYAAAFQPAPEAAHSQPSQVAPAPPATRPAPVAAAPTTKGACLIKGNINSDGEKIYHVPGGRSYDRTKINKPGERWFCTEAEAQAAGFRAARD